MRGHRITWACIGLVLLAVIAGGCAGGTSASPEDDAARELGELKDRLDEVDQDIDDIKPEEPITRDSVMRYAAEVGEEVPRYAPIKEDILAKRDEVQDVDDPDVVEAAELLVLMVEQRYGGMQEFVDAVGSGDFSQEALAAVEQMEAEVNATNADWEEVANRLNQKYAD